MTTKQKQQCMDYEEFIKRLSIVVASANEDKMITRSAVDAVITEYTVKLQSLKAEDK